MNSTNTMVGVFSNLASADKAIQKLATEGFFLEHLSIVGKGYCSDEKVVGFYKTGDRIKFWGTRGARWGGLWELFSGGLVLNIPVAGHVIVIGYLASRAMSVVEGAGVTGGLSAIGAALNVSGLPQDSVIKYETALGADSFLVMAYGSKADVIRARCVLQTCRNSHVYLHCAEPQIDNALAIC